MDIIRTWTDPTDFNKQDPNKVARGSGEVFIRKDWQNPNLHDTPVDSYLKSAPASHIINFDSDSDKVKEIHIPKNFYSKTEADTYKVYGYNLEIYEKKNAPKVIQDIKKILNSKNYNKLDKLDFSIEKLNYIIAKKIYNINNNIKNNQKFDYNEELWTYRMEKKKYNFEKIINFFYDTGILLHPLYII